MAGGYRAPDDGLEVLSNSLAKQRARLRELERPNVHATASPKVLSSVTESAGGLEEILFRLAALERKVFGE